jgi:hypothetical protein
MPASKTAAATAAMIFFFFSSISFFSPQLFP